MFCPFSIDIICSADRPLLSAISSMERFLVSLIPLILEPTNELLLDIFYTVFYFLPYYFCVVWLAKLRKNMELPTIIAKKYEN
jgi:ABC-type uncharacterized transport system permease subunit